MGQTATSKRPSRADANAAALAQAADELAQAGTTPDAPAPPAEPPAEPARPSRREVAHQAAERTAAKPLVLSQGCEWHVTPGVGKSGITVEVDAQNRVREYLTWVPNVGRVQKMPMIGVYGPLDAGDFE